MSKASIINLSSIQNMVYVIMGIDEHEHDQVLAVCKSYEDAKRYCIEYLRETNFFDLWIEKHSILS